MRVCSSRRKLVNGVIREGRAEKGKGEGGEERREKSACTADEVSQSERQR